MERSPNAAEAAAIAAAIARFRVETAPVEAMAGGAIGPWQRAALVEGIGARSTVQKHREGGFEWLS